MTGDYSTCTAGVGNRIREKREARGMSATELSIQAGITSSALSRIELDVKAPRFETLCSLAEALQVSLQEIQPPSLDGYNTVPSMLLPSLRKLSQKTPDEQAKLVKMFEAMIDIM